MVAGQSEVEKLQNPTQRQIDKIKRIGKWFTTVLESGEPHIIGTGVRENLVVTR
ncbi:hypothetical protein OK016_11880 [Vibrio chagasii]|nr:hypothetical protein [Vibrio chagasii]